MDKLDRYSLIELVDVRDGTHDSPKYVDDGFPLITSKNLINGSVDFENVNFITETDYHSINKRSKVDEGDILYSMIGSIGNFAIVNFEPRFAIKNVALIKFKNSKLSSKYFIHYIKSNEFTTQIEKQSKGGTQKFVTLKILRNIQVPLPSLPQQQKIANILDTADALRQNDKALVAKYDELIQALFLDMFGDVISNSKNWNSKRFEEIISLKRGYDLPNNDRITGNIPVVASTGVVGFHNESKVKGGCVVTGRSGSIGKVQLITVDCWPLNTSLYGYKTFNNNLVYLKYFVSYFRIERFSHGAGVPTLDRKLVHKELAPIPPLELQNQFADRVALIEEQKAIAQASLIKSEELFNSLLQKAFKGELVN